jgi:hypothetical protein
MGTIRKSVEISFTVANERELAIAAAIALRDDYDAARLREFANQSEDADYIRRLVALAAVSMSH